MLSVYCVHNNIFFNNCNSFVTVQCEKYGEALQKQLIYWSMVCYVIFLNELIEYDITNKWLPGLAWFKKNYNLNYRENALSINLDDDKYRTREYSIWGLNWNANHWKKTACVYQCVPYVVPFGNCLPGTELLQAAFRSLAWYYFRGIISDLCGSSLWHCRQSLQQLAVADAAFGLLEIVQVPMLIVPWLTKHAKQWNILKHT